MSKKKLPPVLLLAAANTTLAHPVAACLRKLKGVPVHLLQDRYCPDGEELTPIIRFSRFVKSYHESCAPDLAGRLETLREVLGSTGAAVVMPVGEETVELANLAARELDSGVRVVPLPSTRLLREMTDKSRLAAYMESRGLPMPPTWFGGDLYEAAASIRDEDFPLLAKPSIGHGGVGIRELPDRPSLNAFLKWRSRAGAHYILQKKASGPTVDLNVFFDNGRLKAACVQETVYPGSDGLDYPRTVSISRDEAIEGMAQDLLGPVKWNGVAHIDLIWDQGQRRPWFLEVNGRYWSTLFGGVLAGINFPWLSYSRALELPWEEPDFRPMIYHHGLAAVKKNLSQVFSRDRPKFSPGDTNFVFTFSDPTHLAAQVWSRLERRVNWRGKKNESDPVGEYSEV